MTRNDHCPETALSLLHSASPLEQKLAAYGKTALEIRNAGRIPDAIKLLESQNDLEGAAFFWNRLLENSLKAGQSQEILADFTQFAKTEGDWERSIDEEDWLRSEINEMALVHEEIILKTIKFLIGQNLLAELIIRMAPLAEPGYWMEDIIEELEREKAENRNIL